MLNPIQDLVWKVEFQLAETWAAFSKNPIPKKC